MRLHHEFWHREGGSANVSGRRSVIQYAFIGFAVQIAFIVGTIVFVLLGAISQDSAIVAAGEVSQMELTNVSMQTSFLDAQRSLRGYQITGADRFLQSYYAERFQYTITLKQARAAAWPAIVADLERQARTAAVAYRLDDELAAAPPGSGPARAASTLFSQATEQSDRYVRQNRQLQDRLAAIGAGLTAVAKRSLGIGIGTTAGAIIVALIIPVVYALLLVRLAIVPLRATTKTVRRLAAGDHSARAAPGGPAEIWELAASINHLADENDRLRAIEEDRERLKAAMRGTAVRIREHLRADAIIRESVTGLTERLVCDRAWVALFRDGRLTLPAGNHADLGLGAVMSRGTSPFSRYDTIADIYRRRGSQSIDLSPSAAAETSGVREVLADGTHLLVVPFGTGQNPQGIVILLREDPGRPWTAAEQTEIESLAGEIGRGLDHARMYREEEELVEQLRTVDRAKTSFIASASHDLQTPLTSIAGYTELLMDGDLGPVSEPQAQALAAVERSARRLRGLIEDMLTMSKIEMGVFASDLRPVDLAALVPAAADAIRPTADADGLHLDVSRCEPGLTVNADAAQLDRVLMNLLSNAVKYTPAGGSVTVTAVREDGSAVVRVADTGIGIPEEEHDSLFTPFFRASNAVARAIPGSGLGLSIVATIIRNHHGDIRLRSAAGEGTTVSISLPLLTPGQGSR